jgi:hypothetical protein
MIEPVDEVAGLTERWELRWPTCRPIGHELRTSAADRWVRFHSLPGSKRYAETPLEQSEMLARHNTVLCELFKLIEPESEPPVALIFTSAWGDQTAIGREPDLVAADPTASFWRSDEWDPDPDSPAVWTHRWTSKRPWSSGSIDTLLTLVADSSTADVIVAPDSLAWLYHPYDGGADVIAPSSAARDRLAVKYQSWLSRHPTGL